VSSVLSSLPTFYLSTLKVYHEVLKKFDEYRKHCMWRKNDLEDKSSPLVAWDLVCLPKDQGGLGVINLIVQNNYLLMKHLHKFFKRANIPWVNLLWEVYYSAHLPPSKSGEVSFWWRDCLNCLLSFKQLVGCSVQSGSSVLLWHDK
jgi:hypothetical protein